MTWRRLETSAVALAILFLWCVHNQTSAAYADDARTGEWHLSSLDVFQAQRISRGDGIVVAILDSGVDASHRDLSGNVIPGADYFANTDGREDLEGHGTEMAGLVAAHGTGDSGIVGIAPNAKILPVRIFSHTAGGLDSGYPEGGFAWASRHGARVISASFGTHDTPALRADVDAAIAADIVVIAAAGNLPADRTIAYPAAIPGVVAVTGVDKSGMHDPAATSGAEVTISAPSVEIESTYKHNSYAISSGTSDATAIVAGVAALIRAKYPKMSAAEVVHRMTATATDKGPPGRDPDYGYGIINPVAALTADVPPLSGSPSPAPAISQATQAKPTGLGPGTVALLGAVLLAVAVAGLSIAVVRRRNANSR